MKLYPRGSEWRKWDLHVHTPSSLVHNYSGTDEQAWVRFIDELEALPPEFKVLGINDYFFLDGYRKVRDIKNSGRLANIDLILPVIELRIDKFGGSDSKLSRVNYHIIFSNELEPDLIEQQFLNALTSKYQLNDQFAELKNSWSGVITRSSLSDLGEKIIASVPKERRRDYGSPLIEGFNHLNLNLQSVFEILSGNYFEGKFLTAVGKTEWADIRWNDQSVADKKTIINQAAWVFISSANIADWTKAKRHLKDSNVNDRLLDCSDAHYFSDSAEKDRIGKCWTWIKADPTFSGLQLAMYEPDERVFIGEKPEKIKQVDANSTKYINKLFLTKKADDSFSEHWFEQTTIELNHDLIAIIGNKGSGKSALADILGLLGNTPNHSRFSFLNSNRFCKPPEVKAQYFDAALEWKSGTKDLVNLSQRVDETAFETIKYIPQGLFEEICSEVPGGKRGKFDEEIERVIFSRIPTADRLSLPNLEMLIDYKTQEMLDAISLLKQDLQGINQQIIELENESTRDYQKRIKSELELKTRELAAHDKQKPKIISPPKSIKTNAKLDKQILKVENEQSELIEKVNKAVLQQDSFALQLTILDKLLQRIENLRQTYKRFFDESKDDFETLKLNSSELIKLTVNEAPVILRRKQITDEQGIITKLLDPNESSSLVSQLHGVKIKLDGLRDKLDQPNREYQHYQQELQKWQLTREEITGNVQKPNSLEYLQAKMNNLATVQERLNQQYESRMKLTTLIHIKIVSLSAEYRKLYAPVQTFIDTNPIAKGKLALNFDVSIVDIELANSFFEWVSRSAAGSFRGSSEGAKMLQNLTALHNFDTADGVQGFLNDLMEYLRTDKRGTGSTVQIHSQLKSTKSLQSFYDYIFSLDYLRPRYILKMADKELSQLSPGEKGALLLVFYLLVDKSDTPLVIDQPEENLDNQTVFQLLVNAIKDAKKRRQIIMVTHNPNLAVVCDAEQVVCAAIDKAFGNKVEYVTGSIEDPVINQHIVDILEGTMPAFANRKVKYRNQ